MRRALGVLCCSFSTVLCKTSDQKPVLLARTFSHYFLLWWWGYMLSCLSLPSSSLGRDNKIPLLIHFPYAACAGCFLHVTSFFFFSPFSFVRATAETELFLRVCQYKLFYSCLGMLKEGRLFSTYSK